MGTMTTPGAKRVEPAGHPRILCVDDEPEVLAALCDVLHKRFTVSGAASGREALQLLVHAGPFAVVMSDFAMPGMNGVEFLALARVAAPETVRVLLTGHASVGSAIAAVNDGHIFRFLTKPCSPSELVNALDDAVDQCRMVTADRALLEHKLEALSEHLLRAERLASLGTMAAVVGHELNNVLTTMTGAMQLIQEDVAQGRLPAAEDLTSLQRAGDHLAKHSRSLLRLGRPAPEGEPRATDLRVAVNEVIGTLRLAGLFRRIHVELEASSEPVMVGIGRTEIEQVLVNLLKNAVEALSETQNADPLVQIGIVKDSVRATLAVSDNASGVPAEKLPLIFEPYYTTKSPERGTGLGLYAVRQIVKAAGGDVSVDSSEDRGTVFRITLPLVVDERRGI